MSCHRETGEVRWGERQRQRQTDRDGDSQTDKVLYVNVK